MRKEQKAQVIEQITAEVMSKPHLYVTDTTGLDAEKTSKLRRLCNRRGVKLIVVKNTLLKRALEATGVDYSPLFPILKGTSAIMLSDVNNAPAKLIKEFRAKDAIPAVKGAYVEECFYIGDNQLETLINIKSKNELLGELIGLLQSPVKNVIGALQSGGNTIAGVLKTLEERAA